jgi:hypothetical protein
MVTAVGSRSVTCCVVLTTESAGAPAAKSCTLVSRFWSPRPNKRTTKVCVQQRRVVENYSIVFCVGNLPRDNMQYVDVEHRVPWEEYVPDPWSPGPGHTH